VLLFAAYEVYGKTFEVQQDQGRLNDAIDAQWRAPAPPPTAAKPPPGYGVARLYIPRLNLRWVVVQGVTPRDIKLAPGHYPSSQLPGELGNFAVAGHRSPRIFWDLDRVHEGDALIVETRTHWYVYLVTKQFIVLPTEVSVVAKNPDQPGAAAAHKYATLTTCNPKWDNYQRLIIRGELSRQQLKSAGRPAELAGM